MSIVKLHKLKQKYVLYKLLHKYRQQDSIARFLSFRSDSRNIIGNDCPIWCCWWQGEENMPEPVKTCYNSIKKYAGRHPVILITDDNVSEYLSIPQNLQEKRAACQISLTHYSDIARMYLLKQYGGIWLDATILLTQSIDSIVDTSKGFWTLRHVSTNHNVSAGLWTSFFIASGKGNVIPEYIYYSLINWWGRNDKVLNYLLLDYIFKAGYNAVPQIKAIIDDLPVQRISTMVKHLKEPYSEALWAELTSHSGLHKLTWKKQFPLTDKYGSKTLYNFILNNYR